MLPGKLAMAKPINRLLLCGLLLCGAYLSALIGHSRRDALRLATFGTSLTAGNLWQSDLKDRLTECLQLRIEVLNRGKSGATSGWGAQNAARVIAVRPNVVVVEFAINDAFNPYAISLEKSYQDTVSIVNALRNGLPAAKIWLMTTNPAFTSDRPHLADYYAQYRSLASALDVGLIDLFPIWLTALAADGGERLMPDRLHPTREGYREVAISPMARHITNGRCN
jgi:acyl-CoA thioesterase-1